MPAASMTSPRTVVNHPGCPLIRHICSASPDARNRGAIRRAAPVFETACQAIAIDRGE